MSRVSRTLLNQDIPTATLKHLFDAGRIKATTDFSVVKDLDTINICVPTPLGKSKEPDMSYIVKSCESLAKHFVPGKLVILESTTYPGTTYELMLPMFEKGGLKQRGGGLLQAQGHRRTGAAAEHDLQRDRTGQQVGWDQRVDLRRRHKIPVVSG